MGDAGLGTVVKDLCSSAPNNLILIIGELASTFPARERRRPAAVQFHFLENAGGRRFRVNAARKILVILHILGFQTASPRRLVATTLASQSSNFQILADIRLSRLIDADIGPRARGLLRRPA
jgi:hypothetical protein